MPHVCVYTATEKDAFFSLFRWRNACDLVAASVCRSMLGNWHATRRTLHDLFLCLERMGTGGEGRSGEKKIVTRKGR